MSHEDAELVITTMAKYKEFFVDIMMTQELDLQVPEEDHVKESLKEGVVMFCSFAFFGFAVLMIIPIQFQIFDRFDQFFGISFIGSITRFF